MPDKIALEEDIALTVDLEQEAHSATQTWKVDWACWAVVVAEAWAMPVPALRIADKLWRLRAWKPRT